MHLMICHRCVLVFTEFLDFLKQLIILIWDFLLFYRILYKKLNKDENTIQQSLQRKSTGPIDKDGKIHSV